MYTTVRGSIGAEPVKLDAVKRMPTFMMDLRLRLYSLPTTVV